MKTSRLIGVIGGEAKEIGYLCEFTEGGMALLNFDTEDGVSISIVEMNVNKYLEALTLGGMITVHKLRETLDCYKMVRNQDLTGNSGTGDVAEAVSFPNGYTVVRWLTRNSLGTISTVVYKSLEDAIKVHGHNGATVFEKV